MIPEDRGSHPVPPSQPEPNPTQRPGEPPAQRPYIAYPAGQPYQGQPQAPNPYPNQFPYGQPQPARPGTWQHPAPVPGTKKSKNGLLLWGGLAAGLVVLAIVAVLVVVPFFNRSTRTEADPFAVSRNTPAAPAGGSAVKTSPTAAPASGSTAAPATPGMVPAKEPTTTVVGKGEFTRIDAIHYARGTAIVGIGNEGKKVLRFENFTSAQGPDLKVYLGKNADGSQIKEGGVNLGPLPATDGSYNIALPDDLDLSQYKSVVIWCEAFSVTFSVASLS